MKRRSKVKNSLLIIIMMVVLIVPSTLVCMLLTKNGLEKEMYDKLNVATFSPRSEYGKITEEEMYDLIWRIKAQTGVDYIIFKDDISVISTIKGINNLQMDEEIYLNVSKGREYFSIDFELGNNRYYGYYYPITKDGNYIASILACYSSNNMHATLKSIVITNAIITIVLCIFFIDMNSERKHRKKTKKMWFCDAIEFLKQGYKIKRKEWKGYWDLENGEVIMHCATPDGDELTPINIKDTDDIIFTLSNVAADDWEVVLEKGK